MSCRTVEKRCDRHVDAVHLTVRDIPILFLIHAGIATRLSRMSLKICNVWDAIGLHAKNTLQCAGDTGHVWGGSN